MSVEVQIPGTKFYVQLADVKHEWYVQLLINGNVEEETLLSERSNEGLVASIQELLQSAGFPVNPIQLKRVSDTLIDDVPKMFGISPKTSSTSLFIKQHNTEQFIQEQKIEAQHQVVAEPVQAYKPIVQTIDVEEEKPAPVDDKEIAQLKDDIEFLMMGLQDVNEKLSQIDMQMTANANILQDLVDLTGKLTKGE